MRLDALVATLLLPDRLPSLIVLVGFWLPPALAGWAVASFLPRGARRHLTVVAYAGLATFTGAIVLPGSAVACAVAFYSRARAFRQMGTA